MKKNNLLSCTILLLAAMIWGFAFVSQNMLADTLEPFTVNTLRSYIACAALIPVAFVTRRIQGKRLLEQTAAERKTLIKAGVVCGLLLCLAANLQQFGIAIYPDGAQVEAHSGFLTALYIFFVPIFGLFLHKKPPLTVTAGVVIAVVGLYFLCLSDGWDALYMGDIVVLLCGMTYGVQILCVDHFSTQVDSVKLCAIEFFVTGIISTVLMFLFEKPDMQAILDGWAPLLYLALMSSAVGYTLQIVGQKYATSPSLASILMSMESVFAALGGAVFMGVMPKTAELIGCGLMLVAIVVAQIPTELFRRKKA